MKVKLEDLTIKQIGAICANNDSIVPYNIGKLYKTEVEIPDNFLK